MVEVVASQHLVMVASPEAVAAAEVQVAAAAVQEVDSGAALALHLLSLPIPRAQRSALSSSTQRPEKVRTAQS